MVYRRVRAQQFLRRVGRLHAQIGQDLRHDPAGIGRHGAAAAPTGAGGGIQRQQHDILGIVRRREAHEGKHRFAGLAFIRRAGLAADAVAADLAVAPRAGGHHVLQAPPHDGGGVLADDLPHGRGIMAGNNITAAVHHALHHIGGVEVAAVDSGRLRRDERYRGGIEVLAEGVAGQIQLRGRFQRGENARGLAVQINAAAADQAEILHVLIEFFFTQPQAVGDEGGVAGVSRCLLQRLVAVAAAVAAVDGGVQHADGAAAVKGGVLVNDALLQRRRQRQRLEGGARLIGVVDGLVAPLTQLRPRQIQLAVFHHFRHDPVIDRRGVVEVVAGVGGHGQNGAGLHVHHDARGAVGRLGGVHHLRQRLFHIVLHRSVQRQHDVAAVLGLVILLIAVGHVVARVVLAGHHQTRLAVQNAVIPRLQPVQTVIIRAHEADDLGGEGGIGVVALGVGDHVHALYALVIDIAADLIGHILLHPQLQHLVLGVCALHFFQDALFVDLQYLRELLRHAVLGPGHGFILVAERAVYLQRGQKYRFRRGRNGHDVAVAVIDGAAGGRDLRAAGLLIQRLGLQLVMPQDLQGKELEEKRDKHHHA